MWDLIVSVPDHCLSFYFGLQVAFKRTKLVPATMNESGVSQQSTVSLF